MEDLPIILLFSGSIVTIFFFYLTRKLSKENKNYKIQIENYKKEKKQTSELLESFQKQVYDLTTELENNKLTIEQTKYADIKSMISNLNIQYDKEKIKFDHNLEEYKANATHEINENLEKSKQKLQDTNDQYNRIISEAEEKAKKIIGDSYEALKKVEILEETANAMQNIIDGYGTRYISSSNSILDDLAEDYTHSQAGQDLKLARYRTKQIFKNNKAADCDYVERVRRETAIAFIIDAFNGKVDTILSKLKYDNYGTMKQKIIDSFHIVNNLGKPFRDARISKEYLDARLEELKYAVIVLELKEKDRAEQRAIKEQIREEEKARRDYEKALKEAEKEEEMLRKAMEKVESQLENSNEQQRQEYEAKLQELNNKLAAAEEKNQRALSMAQQTKSGHVYIISNIGSFGEDVFKIGMTRRLEPLDRVKELGDASVPFSFDVHAMLYSEDAPAFEGLLHKKFTKNQVNKVNPRKEFFRVSLTDIRKEIENMNIQAKWTMIAEAKEYYETLALKKDYSVKELSFI